MRLNRKIREPKSKSSTSTLNGSDYRLFLKINANRAADLVPAEPATDESRSSSNSYTLSGASSRKSVNPVLVASINNIKKRTSRRLNTSQPSWDATLLLPLKKKDYSQVLNLTVWDKHKRYKNYLGELRLNVSDIFHSNSKFTSKKELQWYKLYSNKQYHSYVTGSLLLSFELVVEKKKLKRQQKAAKDRSTISDDKLPDVLISATSLSKRPSVDLCRKFDTINISEADSSPINISEVSRQKIFEDWIETLIYPDPDPIITQPDDQGFYSDSNEESNPLITDISDIESIEPNSNSTSKHIDPVTTLHNNQLLKLNNNSSQWLSVDDRSSISEASVLSSDSAIVSDNIQSSGKGDTTSQRPKKRSKFRKMRIRKNTGDTNFELSNRKVLGVIFLEIVSCSDLPPLKSITRTSFDMDPFVVVTFGKKTFRTSWKYHTLNPIFNERLAFEILPHESNFNVQFSILDKDHFSFHDNVASVSLPMKDITDMATSSTSNVPSLNCQVSFPLNTLSDTGFTTGDYESPSQNSSIRIIEDDNMVHAVKKKKFTKRKKVTVSYTDTSNFKTMDLSLNLHKEKYTGKYNPKLKVRVRFEPYENLRRQFWGILLEQYNVNDNERSFDYIELMSLLDTLGCHNSDELVNKIFGKYQKSPWGGDVLNYEEIIDSLEYHISSTSDLDDGKLFEIERCPICCQKRLSKKEDIDIITHFAICASKDWSIVNKLLVSSYVTPQIATKKWFSKVLIKLTYGKYQLGSKSANILVQDRTTGIIMEEKMSVYVRLGIRLLYNGLDKAKTKRVRILLKKLSVKQGIKFDSPQSKNDIESFIKFHKLDLSQFLETNPNNYATFNEFFYRKLKPDARPLESPNDNGVVVSPADCRCTAFVSVNKATELWIKGCNFTIAKLFNGNFNNLENTDLYKSDKCSLGIFRLAPQDYHRFHSPVDGTIKNIKHIDGEYYTVNPMAIRSELDVFGENVRAIIPIETEKFGTVIMVAVGAMMVGSIVLTKKEGDEVKRGAEVGYFKFGGSTILILLEKKYFQFDSDLVNNSKSCVETLIRVGQSIGHSPDVDEFKRDHIDFGNQSKDFKLNLIRVLTGGDLDNANEISNWESSNITITQDDINDLINNNEVSIDENYGDDYDDGSFEEEGSIMSEDEAIKV